MTSLPFAHSPWRTVWVTGASSGIGRVLVIALAKTGANVAASARSAGALEALAAEGRNITPFAVDVTDRAAVKRTAQQILEQLGALDLAIFNAGIWESMRASNFDAEVAARSIAVNYLGLVNGIDAVLPSMLARRAGHIALMSSVAGYRGLAGASAYSPSKAAVISLAETLKLELEAYGIGLSVINPGYVDTPMTRTNKFPMPFIVSAEVAASRILAGLARRRTEIAFPWQTVALLKFLRIMPAPVFYWFAKNFIGRGRPQP